MKAFEPVVLASASDAREQENLLRWGADDVLGMAQGPLMRLLARMGATQIQATPPGQGGMPPYLALTPEGRQAGIYLVCISRPAAYGALAAPQYVWCGQHPDCDIWLLPCTVEKLADDYTHCVLRMAVCLREGGRWKGSAEVRQFLPTADMGENPHAGVWGTASRLKHITLLREVANRGQALYPYIAGLAASQQMPGHYLLKGSGTESPIMLVLAEGRKEGRLQLLYGDFYSWENPVNELEIYRLPKPEEEPVGELLDGQGVIYTAAMPELAIFPGLIQRGMHFRWAVSLLVSEWSPYGQGAAGAAEASGEVAASFMQDSGTCYSTMVSRVAAVKKVEWCGVPGYCLQAPVSDESPELLFNVYVFEPALKGAQPRVGDMFGCCGSLYAVPDARVAGGVCWADSPEAALAAHKRMQTQQGRGASPLPPLDEAAAARLFAEMMGSHDAGSLAPYLDEGLHYCSATADVRLFGRKELLRHLRDRFDEWEAQGIVPMLEFHPGTILREGRRRPCTIAAFQKKVFSATLFRLEGGRIIAMDSVDGEELQTLELA